MDTPALVVDLEAVEANLRTMAAALPGARLRPHVKAHKCTALARLQRDLGGHRGFTCATIREVEGMAAAGLGDDLLLANEVLDCARLGRLDDARITVAVDSVETIEAAARGGVHEVLVDVNVGLPRCGCHADDAGRLADLARSKGLVVRGVMGYEGHATAVHAREGRAVVVEKSMTVLRKAHDAVGGDVISAGSTVTYDLNKVATEIQAGSYVLMDSYFAPMAPAFVQAFWLELTVISVNTAGGYAVADGGLKCLGMDHGPPTMVDGHEVLIVSDEHITFKPASAVSVGDRVRIVPAHVDPTVAYHDRFHISNGDAWDIDLRGW
jgi:D-serine deaminase-like pyridoxal phosphate-dependent protein